MNTKIDAEKINSKYQIYETKPDKSRGVVCTLLALDHVPVMRKLMEFKKLRKDSIFKAYIILGKGKELVGEI